MCKLITRLIILNQVFFFFRNSKLVRTKTKQFHSPYVLKLVSSIAVLSVVFNKKTPGQGFDP